MFAHLCRLASTLTNFRVNYFPHLSTNKQPINVTQVSCSSRHTFPSDYFHAHGCVRDGKSLTACDVIHLAALTGLGHCLALTGLKMMVATLLLLEVRETCCDIYYSVHV